MGALERFPNLATAIVLATLLVLPLTVPATLASQIAIFATGALSVALLPRERASSEATRRSAGRDVGSSSDARRGSTHPLGDPANAVVVGVGDIDVSRRIDGHA